MKSPISERYLRAASLSPEDIKQTAFLYDVSYRASENVYLSVIAVLFQMVFIHTDFLF